MGEFVPFLLKVGEHDLEVVNLSFSPTSFFKFVTDFHPLLFSVSPTCRFHLLVDFTYLNMPLGMFRSHVPGPFLGSYVVNRVLTLRLVQRLKGILLQRKKVERHTRGHDVYSSGNYACIYVSDKNAFICH